MVNFIKKHRLTLAVIGLIALIGINIYLFVSSGQLSSEIEKLENLNRDAAFKIDQSQQREEQHKKKLEEKTTAIRDLDKNLTTALTSYRTLEAKLNKQTDGQSFLKPVLFNKLDDCQDKYQKLITDFNLCLETNSESQTALNLCLDKTNEQQSVIQLQKELYDECREQNHLKDRQLENTQKSLKTLDRHYKRKMLKKGIGKYLIGIVAGVVAGYFVFGLR